LFCRWYKNNAIEFSRLQICVDVFLFSNQYTDVATFSALAKYTSGNTFYYPGFFGPRDGEKFETEMHQTLTRATAFEAVMRVRATKGLRISNFYGNFFIRGTDLLALPNCTSESVYAMDLSYDDPTLNASAITVQAALLYTNSNGERRIRIHTMVIPVTQSLPEMLASTDIDCAVNITAKQAVEISLKSGLDNSRQRIHQNCVEILRGARTGSQQQQPGFGPGYQQRPDQSQQPPPPSLQLLPLYSMSLQKNLALRGGADVRTDERAFFQNLLLNMDIEESKVFIYPRMFSIHDMPLDAGTPVDNAEDIPTAGLARIRLPAILNLSHERLTSEGLFLLENGYDLFLWIGRNVSPAILDTLFGVSSLEGIDLSQLHIHPDNSDFSYRVNSIILALRSERSRYLQLHFIKEGDGYAEAFFSRFLVEDRYYPSLPLLSLRP
jgi:protein transport protein SEC24